MNFRLKREIKMSFYCLLNEEGCFEKDKIIKIFPNARFYSDNFILTNEDPVKTIVGAQEIGGCRFIRVDEISEIIEKKI